MSTRRHPIIAQLDRTRLAPARFDGSTGPRKIGPQGGTRVDLKSLGARFLVWAEESGGTFSLVEHPTSPPGVVLADSDLPARYAIEFQPESIAAQVGRGPVAAPSAPRLLAPRDRPFRRSIDLALDATDTAHRVCAVLESIPGPGAWGRAVRRLGWGGVRGPSGARITEVNGRPFSAPSLESAVRASVTTPVTLTIAADGRTRVLPLPAAPSAARARRRDARSAALPSDRLLTAR